MRDELSVILDRYEQLVGRLRETDPVAGEKIDHSRKTVERLKKFNGKLVEFQKALGRKKRTHHAR